MKRIPENGYDVKELFIKCDRNYYTNEAYDFMFELFAESELDDFDVIGWCCDFNEETPDYIVTDVLCEVPEGYKDMDEEERAAAVCEMLNNHTMAIITEDYDGKQLIFYQVY